MRETTFTLRVSHMSYASALQRVEANYASALDSKTVIPLSLANSSANFIILIVWLVASRSFSQSTFKWGRWPVFLSIVSISLRNLLYCRSIGVIGSLGVGLNSGLCTIFAVNFLFLHDPRAFQKLSIKPLAVAKMHGRPPMHADQYEAGVHHDNDRPDSSWLWWEPMPESIWSRILWALDLLTSVRGVQWYNDMSPSSWNYQPYGSSSLDRGSSLPRNIFRFALDYFLVDLIKCLMIADPYFIGFPSHAPPPHITAYITSPLVLYTYRMLLAAAGTYVAIDLIFAFAVILQVNILGPSVIGLNASSAMFPPLWGNPRAILDKGLRGFWGETWHQMLRMHFVSIGDAIAGYVLPASSDTYVLKSNNKEQKRSKSVGVATAIRITTAFLLSGILHACTSYTLLGPTKPWAPFLFFALQPLGIGIQTMLSPLCFKLCLSGLTGFKTTLYQCFNLGFTILWLWACCGLLANDMTDGGVWLFEPVPVSLIRGFGFSKEDDRLWCW